MADPVATVEKIVKIGLKIKDAVDTVRYNEEECEEIKKRVLRFSAILSQLQQTGVMEGSPALSGALKDLAESLQHALDLVTACQETSTIRRLITAGDLSKQLQRVKHDISDKVMLASFAINTRTILLTIQAGSHPLPLQSKDAEVVEISHDSQSTDDARFELNDANCNILAGAIKEFKWSELKAATNGFSRGNIIGEGAFFVVYKGVLKDGNIVAIKKNKANDYEAAQDYYDKLLTVSKLKHKNIVKVVGYSLEAMPISLVQLFKRKKDRAKERGFIWVEEYVPNGTLDRIIYGSRDTQLDWSSLFRIIMGVAQGVQYLHEQRVVHMDVKPPNILLDSNMNAMITDFGRRVALDNNDEMTTECVIGSMGYIPREYMEEGILSVKNDVFGFGITLLDIVGSIRRCPGPPRAPRRKIYIDRWAWKAWEAGLIEEEFDPSLSEESQSQLTEMKRCVEVGLLCTQRDREDRPTMADVVEMLHGHKDLPVPKIPSWYQEDSNSSPS